FFAFQWIGYTDKESSDRTLQWFAPTALYLLDYLLFQYFKKSASKQILEKFNLILLFGALCFIFPISFIALRKYSFLPAADIFSFKTSLIGILLIPMILFVFLIFFSLYYFFRHLKH